MWSTLKSRVSSSLGLSRNVPNINNLSQSPGYLPNNQLTNELSTNAPNSASGGLPHHGAAHYSSHTTPPSSPTANQYNNDEALYYGNTTTDAPVFEDSMNDYEGPNLFAADSPTHTTGYYTHGNSDNFMDVVEEVTVSMKHSSPFKPSGGGSAAKRQPSVSPPKPPRKHTKYAKAAAADSGTGTSTTNVDISLDSGLNNVSTVPPTISRFSSLQAFSLDKIRIMTKVKILLPKRMITLKMIILAAVLIPLLCAVLIVVVTSVVH